MKTINYKYISTTHFKHNICMEKQDPFPKMLEIDVGLDGGGGGQTEVGLKTIPAGS